MSKTQKRRAKQKRQVKVRSAWENMTPEQRTMQVAARRKVEKMRRQGLLTRIQ